MKKSLDISKMSCPVCKSPNFVIKNNSFDIDKIYKDGIICEKCSKTYPILWGVPYLGQFEEKDILSLIEIETNAKLNIKDGADFMYWLELINKYVLSSNKDKFLQENGINQKPWWFDTRYSEHVTSRVFINQINTAGKDLLDVGAGLGYDSMIYKLAGAKVTSLEFNPILCKIGAHQHKDLRFVGGAAHNLPFVKKSYDIVVANATLHHLGDISKSIEEMLRVLKPGGFLLTTGDPFRADHLTEEDELKIYNNNIYVLSGINEHSPKFSDLVETYKKYEKYLEIRVFTRNCTNNLNYFKEWSFEEGLQKLSSESGSIDFLVKLKEEIPSLHQSQNDKSITSIITNGIKKLTGNDKVIEIINPADYVENLNNGISSIDTIVNKISDKYLDLDVMSNDQIRFDVINGWKLPFEEQKARFAYKRARKFYHTNKIKNKYISISILVPYYKEQTEYADIFIKLNTKTLLKKKIIRGTWNYISVLQEGDITSDRACMLEVGIEGLTDLYNLNLFCINEITFTDRDYHKRSDILELQNFGVETVVLTQKLQGKTIEVLFSPETTHSLDIINRLSKYDIKINAIIMSGQNAFYSWIPNVKIIEEYTNYLGEEETNKNSLKNDPLFIVVPDKTTFESIYKSFDSKLAKNDSYIVLKDGYTYPTKDLLDNFQDNNSLFI